MLVIEKELKTLIKDGATVDSVEEYNEIFLKESSRNYSCVLEAAKIIYDVNPTANQMRALELSTNVSQENYDQGTLNLNVNFKIK